MKYQLVASVVTFNNPISMLQNLIDSFEKAKVVKHLVFVDNSNNNEIKNLCLKNDIEYINSGGNIGFGAAHNIAIKKYASESEAFLILNPDIIIHEGCLEGLYQYLKENPKLGLTSSKILNPDGSIQRVHKRLPSFKILFARRFLPQAFKSLWQKDLDRYELKDIDINAPISVPSISGCFMFFRSSTLINLGGFDDRFFMYFEDIDISLRAKQISDVAFNPNFEVTHLWERGSYNNKKLTLINIVSYLKFFFKWIFKSKKQFNQISYYK